MTRHYPCADVTFSLEHRDVNGTLVNPDAITFEYRLNDETKVPATPTNTATGKYSVVLTPLKSGVLRCEWTVTEDNIDTIHPDQVKIWESRVEGV